MKNKVLKIALLALIPIALLSTIGVSYALWKYSAIVNAQPASDTYTVVFHYKNNSNSFTEYDTYSELEYDSAFELPQGLAANNSHAFTGWSTSTSGALISQIYNRYCDLASSMSAKTLNLYAQYAS
jgi:hypothetical protein